MKKLRQLILQNRSYRRFDNSYKVYDDVLLQLIELTRFIPSAANAQPLKYLMATDKKTCEAIYPNLGWAAYLKDWKGPEPQERPTAYIIILKDKQISDNIYCDDGIAIQTIMLAAVNMGLGGCIMGNVNRKKLSAYYDLPDHIEILYVLALGKPIETVLLDDMKGNDIKYWREENGTHHVPKRKLDDLIFQI